MCEGHGRCALVTAGAFERKGLLTTAGERRFISSLETDIDEGDNHGITQEAALPHARGQETHPLEAEEAGAFDLLSLQPAEASTPGVPELRLLRRR